MIKNCHFIGIGGIGMSGLARILLSKKIPVSGSDLAQSYVTEGLTKAGAKVFVGHSSKYITPQMTVIYNSDIPHDNPEYQAALQMQCLMLHRSDLLLQLMSEYKTLAIAGTHGKTTTTALLTMTLKEAKFDPGFAVGGIVQQLQVNAGHGEGEYFVAEADESDGTFLKYHPYGGIITNIDLDHMNFFGSEDALIASFQQFAKSVQSQKHLLWCGDDARLKRLNPQGTSYGFSPNCAVRAVNFKQNGWHTIFDIVYKEKTYPQISVALIGKHNILNALAVFGLALSLGVPENAIRKAFVTFGGVCRRCEKKGEINDIILLDDYAHHPTEIQTTLQGIRTAIGNRRLIAVFQPHRYTRTKSCLGTFGKAFDAADIVFVTPIYSAGEPVIEGVSHEEIIREIEKESTVPCRSAQRKELGQTLAAFLRPDDVVVGMGAGDITKLSNEVMSSWTNNASH